MVCLSELNPVLAAAEDPVLAKSGQREALEEAVDLSLKLRSWTPEDRASGASEISAAMEMQGRSQLLRSQLADMQNSGGELLPGGVLEVVAAVQREADELLSKTWADR